MKPLIIIGTGLAGYTLAREYRRLQPEVPLVLISRDDGAFYSKPMLSNAISQNKAADQLINVTAAAMSEQLNAAIHTHSVVTTIDRKQQSITLLAEQGEVRLDYQKLVLAIGASPIEIPFEGDGAGQVVRINNLDDYRMFRQRLEGKQRVAIVGAGLIGCEFADDLTGGGYQVDVIDLGTWPLGRLVPQAIGQTIASSLENKGVHFHLAAQVSRIDSSHQSLLLRLDNGVTIETDIVLSAVGLRAQTRLAASAGLAVNRGIVVDALLRTSDTDIHALGDCAEIEGRVLPYIMPLMAAARRLAANLSGDIEPLSYPAMPVSVKTPSCPTVVAPPPSDAVGDWVIDGKAPHLTARFENENGALMGFALTGDAIAQKQALQKELPMLLSRKTVRPEAA